MDLKTSLVEVADRYCGHTGMSKARLATIVANDGKFFDRLEGGGGLTTRTYERAMQQISARWPAALEWPDGVNRPAPQKADAA